MAATIRSLTAGDLDQRIGAFAELLRACVLDGASVGFIVPFPPAEAEAFWRDAVRPPLAAGRRALFAAEVGGALAGTVQLLHDMPPNQPHRAEIAKLLVHPAHRRRGVARALMAAAETKARRMARTLLTLDTRSGDPSETLYIGLGFQVAGVIPGWCRDTHSARLAATTILFKPLA